MKRPGAGIPLHERLYMRWRVMPALRDAAWRAHFNLLAEETERIAALCESRVAEDFARPVLVPRPRGVEDSSRNWSLALLAEHLLIVLDGMTRIAAALARGQVPNVTVDIARVKPGGAFASLPQQDIVAALRRKAAESAAYLAPLEAGAGQAARLPHPWFGPLTAGQWVGLMALHQQIHRRQAEAICARL